LEGYGAGIETFVHAHDRDAGLLFSRHDRAFYGSGAAVAGQERGVHVPGAKRSRIEGVGAQDLTVRRDDEGVLGRDLVRDLADTGRLAQREARGEREFGDWSRRELSSPAAPAVGLGDHEPHLVLRIYEAAQDGGGEGRGAGEC
jgi:hypothetical protein